MMVVIPKAQYCVLSQFDDWDHAYLVNTNGTENKTVKGSPYDSTRGMSYFARLGWTWKERYMVNATMRADGSSKFAKGNRWGYFPSVSADGLSPKRSSWNR